MNDRPVLYYMTVMDDKIKETVGIFSWYADACYISKTISEAVGHDCWNWHRISKTEFETFQAFGIKEIVPPRQSEVYG